VVSISGDISKILKTYCSRKLAAFNIYLKTRRFPIRFQTGLTRLILKKLGQLLSPTVEGTADKGTEIIEKVKDVLNLNEDKTQEVKLIEPEKTPKPAPVKIFRNNITEKTRTKYPQAIRTSLGDKPDTLIYTDKKSQ